jgi:hypothetical protein
MPGCLGGMCLHRTRETNFSTRKVCQLVVVSSHADVATSELQDLRARARAADEGMLR